jgi:hypothetical protein
MIDEIIEGDVKSTGWNLYLFKNPDPTSIVFEHHSAGEPFLEILPDEIDYYCELLQGCKKYFKVEK